MSHWLRRYLSQPWGWWVTDRLIAPHFWRNKPGKGSRMILTRRDKKLAELAGPSNIPRTSDSGYVWTTSKTSEIRIQEWEVEWCIWWIAGNHIHNKLPQMRLRWSQICFNSDSRMGVSLLPNLCGCQRIRERQVELRWDLNITPRLGDRWQKGSERAIWSLEICKGAGIQGQRGRNTEKEMGKKNMNIFYFLFHLRIILNNNGKDNNSNSIYIQHLKILSHLLSFAYVIF